MKQGESDGFFPPSFLHQQSVALKCGYYKCGIAQIQGLLFGFSVVQIDVPVWLFVQILSVCKGEVIGRLSAGGLAPQPGSAGIPEIQYRL